MSYGWSVAITDHSCGVCEIEVTVSGVIGVVCDRLSRGFLVSAGFSDFFFCHHI